MRLSSVAARVAPSPRARGPLPAAAARPAAPLTLLATAESPPFCQARALEGAASSSSSITHVEGSDTDDLTAAQKQQLARPQTPGGQRKRREGISSSDLWNRLQRAQTPGALSSLVCRYEKVLKGRHVSCALERYVKLQGGPTALQHGSAAGMLSNKDKGRALEGQAFDVLRQHVQDHAGSYSARSLSRAMLCLSMLKQSDPQLLELVDCLIPVRAAEFSQESLVALVRAFAYAHASCPYLSDELEAQALSGALPMGPSSLCILAGALSSMQECPRSLLSLVERQIDDELDNCLVWAASPSARKEPKSVQAMLRVLRYRVQRDGVTWPADKLANAARACLSAGGSTPRLLQELGALSAIRIEEFSRSDLVDIAWILSKFGWPAADVMQCLEWKLEMCAVDFTAAELVLSAKAIAAARSYAPEAIARVAQEALRRGPDSFTCRELAHLSRACSSAGGAPFELFEMVATCMATNPQDKPARSLSVVARAVVDAGHTSELHFCLSCVATEVSRRPEEFCPRGLAEAAHALSKVHSRPYDQAFTALGTQTIKRIALFRPRDIIALVRALRASEAEISTRVVMEAVKQAVARETQFSTLQLALMHQEGQHALGASGEGLEDIYSILQERILGGAEELSPLAQEAVAETCAAVGSRSQPVLEAVRLMKYWPS